MNRKVHSPVVRGSDGIEIMIVCIGMVVLPLTLVGYWRMMREKERVMKEAEERGLRFAPEELRRLGDRAPDFRYTL